MVAMRSASEQQLIRDCPSGVGLCERRDENSPTMEPLMTLLWVTRVFDDERRRQTAPELDTATQVRQACDELDDLFRPLTRMGNKEDKAFGLAQVEWKSDPQ